MTKRYSHGLQLQGSYTYSKELENGANNDTTYATGTFGSGAIINDTYNTDLNKQLSSYSQPNQLVISGSYTVPKPFFTDNKILVQTLKDWQLGAVMRYQSGALLEMPTSLNGIEGQLQRGFTGSTTWDLASGASTGSIITVNPNSHFDPTKTLVLSPAAFSPTDSPAGQFGAAAPYYNNVRWQREPAESMSFARNFRMGKEGRYVLNIRAEFQNVFNRYFYSNPAGTGFGFTYPTTPKSATGAYVQGGPAAGALSGGFGYVSPFPGFGSANQPRSGQAVARFTF